MTGVERNKYLYTTCLFLYKVKEITSTTTTTTTTTTKKNKTTKDGFMYYIIIPVTTCPFNVF